MSKKPKKRLSRKVIHVQEQLRRKRGIRDLLKRFLIVCEDETSAPRYFEALKKHFKLDASSVVVVGSGHRSQPIQVVKTAIQRQKQAAKLDSSTEPFDGDYGHKVGVARGSADAKGIKLAVSTMCFEYWVLLHLEEYDKSAVDCDAVVHILKEAKRIPTYAKGSYDYGQIVSKVREACARAEKLRKPGIARNELPEDQNPCSDVYLLINAILPATP